MGRISVKVLNDDFSAVQFPYNPGLVAKMKTLRNRRWHPEHKLNLIFKPTAKLVPTVELALSGELGYLLQTIISEFRTSVGIPGPIHPSGSDLQS